MFNCMKYELRSHWIGEESQKLILVIQNWFKEIFIRLLYREKEIAIFFSFFFYFPVNRFGSQKEFEFLINLGSMRYLCITLSFTYRDNSTSNLLVFLIFSLWLIFAMFKFWIHVIIYSCTVHSLSLLSETEIANSNRFR